MTWADRSERANRQIVERAASEPAVHGQMEAAAECAASLARAAGSWLDKPQLTIALPRRPIECLGFRVVASAPVLLAEADVDAVYRGAASTASYEQVRAVLITYLVGRPIHLWKLVGIQDSAVLGWWKTYVHHILMDREPGRIRYPTWASPRHLS